MIRCIGIDPAPSKETVVCEAQGTGGFAFQAWKPHEVRSGVQALIARAAEDHVPLVVTWDAPLGLDPGTVPGTRNYASRRIDSAVTGWIKTLVPAASGAPVRRPSTPLPAAPLDRGAVGVANAASCPHNLLTQHVWGLPVGERPAHGARLLLPGVAAGEPAPACVLAEVHPAVAVAAWWLEQAPVERPMPRYKPNGTVNVEAAREGLLCVARFLQLRFGDAFPFDAIVAGAGAGGSDDRLDAWIAWRLAYDWTRGAAHAVGPADGGSYLLPTSVPWAKLQSYLSKRANAGAPDVAGDP